MTENPIRIIRYKAIEFEKILDNGYIGLKQLDKALPDYTILELKFNKDQILWGNINYTLTKLKNGYVEWYNWICGELGLNVFLGGGAFLIIESMAVHKTIIEENRNIIFKNKLSLFYKEIAKGVDSIKAIKKAVPNNRKLYITRNHPNYMLRKKLNFLISKLESKWIRWTNRMTDGKINYTKSSFLI